MTRFFKLSSTHGKVYAFEPEPSNFEKLKANLERNKVTNVIPLHLALSENEGEMHVSSGGSFSTINQAVTSTSVEVTTIDRFVEANKLPRVDFISMDVEGHEIKILAGAKETIKTFKPSLALSAYHRCDDLIKLPKVLFRTQSKLQVLPKTLHFGFKRNCAIWWMRSEPRFVCRRGKLVTKFDLFDIELDSVYENDV